MIEILNENLKKIDILRKYTFAQYTRKFREVGTFQINARLEKENLYLLEKDKEYYVLFDSKIFGKIEDVKKESDSEYERTIVLSGRLSNVLFIKRVVAGTINFNGNTAQFVKAVIENEITKDKESKRYINIDVKYDNEKYLESFCSLIDKQVTGGYVWDTIQPFLEQDRLGIYFNPVVETEHTLQDGTKTNISKWNLLISAGKDRRKGNTQGNVPVIFSQSLSNIARTDYELNLKGYRNVAYVAGEGEEDKRKWYEVYPKEEEKNGNVNVSGWGRSELWIDARDIQSTDEEGNEITEAEYETLIKQRADEKFTDNAVEESYTATLTEANKQYTYGVDYVLGDLVTVIDDELGISIDVQVTGVTKSTEGVREIVDIDFTYGKVNRDPTEQIKNIGGLIEKNNNDIVYIENKIKDICNNIETINNNLTYQYIKLQSVDAVTSFSGIVSPYSIVGTNGDGLTLNDSKDKVIIGKGINCVRVSAMISGSVSSTRGWGLIHHNSNGVLNSISALDYGSYVTIQLNSMFNTTEGDTIYLEYSEFYKLNADGLRSYLIVEKIY